MGFPNKPSSYWGSSIYGNPQYLDIMWDHISISYPSVAQCCTQPHTLRRGKSGPTDQTWVMFCCWRSWPTYRLTLILSRTHTPMFRKITYIEIDPDLELCTSQSTFVSKISTCGSTAAMDSSILSKLQKDRGDIDSVDVLKLSSRSKNPSKIESSFNSTNNMDKSI